MLYSLGQHEALMSRIRFCWTRSSRILMISTLFAPQNAWFRFSSFAQALEEHARIQVHLGKIQVWSRGGHVPPGCDALQTAAEFVDPHARVWRGHGISEEQGIRVLGIPIGHADFVSAQFRRTLSERHPVCARFAECMAPSFLARTRGQHIPSEASHQWKWHNLRLLTMMPRGMLHEVVGSAVQHRGTRCGQPPIRFGWVWVAFCHEVMCRSSLGKLGSTLEWQTP